MVATMAKKKGKPTLKVDPPEHSLLAKLSAFRRVSMADLFKEPDIDSFFKLLLIEEMKKEEKILKDRK